MSLIHIGTWFVLALIGMVLLQLPSEAGEPPRGLWYLEPILFILYILTVVTLFKQFDGVDKKRTHHSKIIYAGLVWIVAMVYEATLSLKEGSLGGVHEDTLTSFLFAQGGYLFLIGAALILFWRAHYVFKDTFYFAAGVGLAEALIFKPILLTTVLSPLFFLTPFVFAYYVFVYSAIIALPYLIVRRGVAQTSQCSVFSVMLVGFLLGVSANIFFGLVWVPLIDLISQ